MQGYQGAALRVQQSDWSGLQPVSYTHLTIAVPGHTAGTFVHQTVDVTVIVNETGKVITVMTK